MNYTQRAHALIKTYRRLYKALPTKIVVKVLPKPAQGASGWCRWDSLRPHDVVIELARDLFRADQVEDLVATLLHELLHAEQAILGLDMAHNDYFQWRAAMLTKATGVFNIWDPENDS